MEKNIGIADNEVESVATEDAVGGEPADFCIPSIESAPDADVPTSEIAADETEARESATPEIRFADKTEREVTESGTEFLSFAPATDAESESATSKITDKTEARESATSEIVPPEIASSATNETESVSETEYVDSAAFGEDEILEAEIIEDDTPAVIPAEISLTPRKRNKFAYGCYLFTKRTFDIVSSGLFLIIFSWLYLILAVVVKCSDGGTVFYRHKRVGKKGKDIYIPKFRSMKKNADKLEDMLTPEQLEQYKREYKIDNDPRITKVGKFLRKSSLDELPNIWAIFTGRISVIGPRPLMREEVEEKYGAYADKLLSVKPGMIGWWAANGRSNCTYDSGERQKMELYYVDHCSIWLDIKIVFKTIAGVVRHKGAK